jgi:hypothetical protein
MINLELRDWLFSLAHLFSFADKRGEVYATAARAIDGIFPGLKRR